MELKTNAAEDILQSSLTMQKAQLKKCSLLSSMTVQDWSNAMDIKELQKILQENGIVGAGGAGFPTNVKMNMKKINNSYYN